MPAVPVPNPPLGDGMVGLRPWVRDDAPALRPACGDPSICAFSTVPWRYRRDASSW